MKSVVKSLNSNTISGGDFLANKGVSRRFPKNLLRSGNSQMQRNQDFHDLLTPAIFPPNCHSGKTSTPTKKSVA